MLNIVKRVFNALYPDRRPDWEQKREREFIQAANGLKTLRVTPEGGMFIDPKELREQIVAAREQLKHLVHNPGTHSRSYQAAAADEVAHEADPSAEGLQDCIEVVAWRRLPSGAAVRYVCLESASTGRYAVATARLFSGNEHSLPSWVDSNTDMKVANAIQNAEPRWFSTVSDAMDAWNAEL